MAEHQRNLSEGLSIGQDSLLSSSFQSTVEPHGGLRPYASQQQQPSFLKSPAHPDHTTPLKTLLEEELQRGSTSINLADRRLTKIPDEICSIETLERYY
jgi:hypothetical protein